MRDLNKIQDIAVLDEHLANPKTMVPDKDDFPHIAIAERDDGIALLGTRR
jgi:hypothetical protein